MKEQSTEVPVSPNVTPPCSLVLKDGQEFVPSTEDLQLWAKTYPGIDVENQLLRMSAWLLANRAKRKTARGIRRFVVGWLQRSSERKPHTARPSVFSTEGKQYHEERCPTWAAH